MKLNYCLLILLGLTTACNPDKKKLVSTSEIDFKTRDDTELFFKNVRQIYYDKETVSTAKLEVFRIKERNQKADYPTLSLAIVNNWKQDEAYLLVEPNELLATADPLKIRWVNPTALDSGTYELGYRNKQEHLDFIGQVYTSILRNHQLFIMTDSLDLPFLNIDQDLSAFRKTTLDYYRLVGAYD